ncbi:hypothetical protein RI065_09835 [Mycoplasmatota bacterium zrk1]
MSKKKTYHDQKKGRPEIPISNGYQMKMGNEDQERNENIEFSAESDVFDIDGDKSNKDKRVNYNEEKPNFITRKPNKKPRK